MARKKKHSLTQDYIDKMARIADLKKRLQAFADAHHFEYMSEFTKSWNPKNDEKIEEITKMGNTFNFHFKGGASAMIYDDTMRLG